MSSTLAEEKNMQSHPSPARKAVHASKAAYVGLQPRLVTVATGFSWACHARLTGLRDMSWNGA
jgi:hypothetical protein